MTPQVTIRTALLTLGIVSVATGAGLAVWGPVSTVVIAVGVLMPVALVGVGLAGGYLFGLNTIDDSDELPNTSSFQTAPRSACRPPCDDSSTTA
jgi:hypothetical protein